MSKSLYTNRDKRKTKAERGESSDQVCETKGGKSTETKTKPKTTQPCWETNKGKQTRGPQRNPKNEQEKGTQGDKSPEADTPTNTKADTSRKRNSSMQTTQRGLEHLINEALKSSKGHLIHSKEAAVRLKLKRKRLEYLVRLILLESP